jgi:hypothetical protein
VSAAVYGFREKLVLGAATGGQRESGQPLISLEPAIGLEPLTCALRVQVGLFPGVTPLHLVRISQGYLRIRAGTLACPHLPSHGAE